MIYVSFWAGPGYEAEAYGLRESLDVLGLEHWIVQREDAGTWVANCGQKAAFIREARERYAGPIVWLDADALVIQTPLLFATLGDDVDIAAHKFKGHELLSGTLYLGDTPGARTLLAAWEEAQRARPTQWDQQVLQRVIEAGTWEVRDLPESYAYIARLGTPGVEPVIYHRQASRRLKRRG